MEDISKIVYCELNLSFPDPIDVYCEEIDNVLMPGSELIKSSDWNNIQKYSGLNTIWNIAPQHEYIPSPEMMNAWYVNSFIHVNNNILTSVGSVTTRNTLLDSCKWEWKEEFNDLKITKFIKSLPLTNHIHARVLCLPPGGIVAIHRDDRNNTLTEVLLSSRGYVSITLNITDGGQPLIFAPVSNQREYKTTNAPIYTFNDYHAHAVRRVSSWRRQIRVTGLPTKEFYEKLKQETIIFT